jgi:hypothetical protein
MRQVSLRGSLALFLALACAGCERGCLSTWLGEHGIGSPSSSCVDHAPAEPGTCRPATGVVPSLQAVDCPDGLARCTEGVVEVSRAYSYPMPCALGPTRCACPWERIDECGVEGCVSDGTEVVVPRGKAVAQLCAPPAGLVVSLPAALASVDAGAEDFACDEQLYRCSHGVVVACSDNAARVVAQCFRGCFDEGAGIDEDGVEERAAVSILCAR